MVVIVATGRVMRRITLVIDASPGVVSSVVLLTPAITRRETSTAPLNVLRPPTVWRR